MATRAYAKRRAERDLRARRLRDRKRQVHRPALEHLRALARTGARAQCYGWVPTKSPGPGREERRLRTIPPDERGLPISKAKMGKVLELAEKGRWNDAATAFADAFLSSYGGGMSSDLLDDLDWLAIWPEGSPRGELR